MSDFQPNTKFYLLSGVKLDHSNKNQILFNSVEEQQAFFKNYIYETVEHGTYQRKTVGVINVPFGFDHIASCNYVMWQNADVSNKWYYAFILSIKYVNPNTAQIIYDLDVFQTYMFDVEFKECYINRQHEKRYQDSSSTLHPVVNKEIEDLDYGNAYRTVMELDIQQIPNVSFMVFGYVGDLEAGLGGKLINRIPLSISYLISPVYVSHSEDTIPHVTFTFNGTELTSCGTALDRFRNDTKLVNSLVSAKLYPFLPGKINYSYDGNTCNLTSDYYNREYLMTSDNLSFMVAKWDKNFLTQPHDIGGKYNYLPSYQESKLMMFPYSYGVLTNKRGDDFIVKLEDIDGENINLLFQGDISNEPKIGYIVCNYNVTDGGKKAPNSTGVYYDQSQGINETIDNNAPIVDDYTASYLQSNSNAIKVAKSNAQLVQQSANNQANNTYNTEQQVLDNKTVQVGRNFTTNIGTGIISGVGAMAGSISTDVVKSGAGIVKSVAEMGSSIVSAVNTKKQEEMTIANSSLIAKNTLKNANISATTDYQTTIASINAKVQDAECVPASAKSLGGDYVFDIIHDCDGIYFQWKTIQPYYVEKLTKYFEMYGYKCNKREVPNLKSRRSWNYIKMAECNLFGNIPQDDLMALRDIYLCGITIWHTSDIGNYNLNNDEV